MLSKLISKISASIESAPRQNYEENTQDIQLDEIVTDPKRLQVAVNPERAAADEKEMRMRSSSAKQWLGLVGAIYAAQLIRMTSSSTVSAQPPIPALTEDSKIKEPSIFNEGLSPPLLDIPFLFKTLRNDKDCFWGAFVLSLIFNKTMELRKGKRKTFTVRLERDVEGLFSYKVVPTDKTLRKSLFSPEEKLNKTKHQSMSYADPTKNYQPAFFGWDQKRKEELVGIRVPVENTLLRLISLYDAGTTGRPYDAATEEEALDYLQRKIRQNIFYTSLDALQHAGQDQQDTYNEILARISWDENNFNNQIVIFKDNLKSRLLAQVRAWDIYFAYCEKRREAGLSLDETTLPLISFYKPLRYYSLQEQNEDLSSHSESSEELLIRNFIKQAQKKFQHIKTLDEAFTFHSSLEKLSPFSSLALFSPHLEEIKKQVLNTDIFSNGLFSMVVKSSLDPNWELIERLVKKINTHNDFFEALKILPQDFRWEFIVMSAKNISVKMIVQTSNHFGEIFELLPDDKIESFFNLEEGADYFEELITLNNWGINPFLSTDCFTSTVSPDRMWRFLKIGMIQNHIDNLLNREPILGSIFNFIPEDKMLDFLNFQKIQKLLSKFINPTSLNRIAAYAHTISNLKSFLNFPMIKNHLPVILKTKNDWESIYGNEYTAYIIYNLMNERFTFIYNQMSKGNHAVSSGKVDFNNTFNRLITSFERFNYLMEEIESHPSGLVAQSWELCKFPLDDPALENELARNVSQNNTDFYDPISVKLNANDIITNIEKSKEFNRNYFLEIIGLEANFEKSIFFLIITSFLGSTKNIDDVTLILQFLPHQNEKIINFFIQSNFFEALTINSVAQFSGMLSQIPYTQRWTFISLDQVKNLFLRLTVNDCFLINLVNMSDVLSKRDCIKFLNLRGIEAGISDVSRHINFPDNDLDDRLRNLKNEDHWTNVLDLKLIKSRIINKEITLNENQKESMHQYFLLSNHRKFKCDKTINQLKNLLRELDLPKPNYSEYYGYSRSHFNNKTTGPTSPFNEDTEKGSGATSKRIR